MIFSSSFCVNNSVKMLLNREMALATTVQCVHVSQVGNHWFKINYFVIFIYKNNFKKKPNRQRSNIFLVYTICNFFFLIQLLFPPPLYSNFPRESIWEPSVYTNEISLWQTFVIIFAVICTIRTATGACQTRTGKK